MTGILEGLTSAFGLELTRLGGIRSTRIQEGYPVTEGDTTFRVETTLGWETSGFFYLDDYLYKYTGVTTAPTYGEFTGVSYYDVGGFYAGDASLPNPPVYVSGAAKDHKVLAEVADYTRIYSALEKMRRSFLVDYATGVDLDTLARNIGVLRESGLINSDTIFRNVIKAIAYAPRGTMYVLELFLDAIFGSGNYQIFEDMTDSGYTSRLGQTTTNNPGQIFITADLTPSTTSTGRALIEAPVAAKVDYVAAAGTTTDVNIYAGHPYSGTPFITGCRYKDEDPYRIVVSSSINPDEFKGAITGVLAAGKQEIDCTFIQIGTSNALSYINPGDLLFSTQSAGEYLQGSLLDSATQMTYLGTVLETSPVVGGGTFVLGVESNTPVLSGGALADAVAASTPAATTLFTTRTDGWTVMRTRTNCTALSLSDVKLPSEDFSTEGNLIGTTGNDNTPKQQWWFHSSGVVTEAAPYVQASNLGATYKNQDRAVALTNSGLTDFLFYRQDARIFPDSIATFEANLNGIVGDFSGPGFTGNRDEFIMEMLDGDPFYNQPGKYIRVGFERTGGTVTVPELTIGFVDRTAGTFIGDTYVFDQSPTGTAADDFPMLNIRIYKHRDEYAQLYINNELVTTVDYADFNNGASPADQYRQIGIYGNNMGGNPNTLRALFIRGLSWSSTNSTELTNLRVLNASTNSTNEVVDDDAAGLLGSIATGTPVRVTQVSSTEGTAANDYLGSALGEYEVSAAAADTLTLKGIRKPANAEVVIYADGGVSKQNRLRIGKTARGASTIAEYDEPAAFMFPQDLGKKIRVYTGASSYEEKTIVKILDPVSNDSYGVLFGINESSVPYSPEKAAWKSLPQQRSSLIEVDSDFTTVHVEAEWSVEPAFRTGGDTGIAFEVLSQESSYAGAGGSLVSTLELPVGYTKPAGFQDHATYPDEALPGPRLSISRSTVRSAYTTDPDRVNAQTTPPAYDYYPFYLGSDKVDSLINTLQKALTAAGVHVNLRRFYVDSQGPHII